MSCSPAFRCCSYATKSANIGLEPAARDEHDGFSATSGAIDTAKELLAKLCGVGWDQRSSACKLNEDFMFICGGRRPSADARMKAPGTRTSELERSKHRILVANRDWRDSTWMRQRHLEHAVRGRASPERLCAGRNCVEQCPTWAIGFGLTCRHAGRQWVVGPCVEHVRVVERRGAMRLERDDANYRSHGQRRQGAGWRRCAPLDQP